MVQCLYTPITTHTQRMNTHTQSAASGPGSQGSAAGVAKASGDGRAAEERVNRRGLDSILM